MIWPAIAGAAVSTGLGFGLNKLFGGGGGGSPGGGGGSMAGALPEPYGPAQDFLEKYFGNFGVPKPFGDRDFNMFEKAIDRGNIDKYTALGLYDTAGISPSDEKYQNVLFDTVKESDAKNITGLLGKQLGMFSGVSPGDKEIGELFELGKLTGKTGSPQEFSNFIAQSLSMDPRYRQPSGQELLAGMKYGPVVNVGGTMQFKANPRSQRMFDKIDEGNKMYYDRLKKINRG